MSYSFPPQHPDEIPGFRKRTRYGVTTEPDRIMIIASPESLLIAAYSKRVDLRDTAREFLGWEVPRLPAMPLGDCAYCTSCHSYKNLRDFSPDDRKVNGRQSHCKECRRLADRRKRLRIA